jgi:hypothetical protein
VRTLAELSFEYIWLLLFGGEDEISPHYSLKCQETLLEYFAALTTEERRALSKVAADTRARLLAEPDEHGYTPRKLVTDEQKKILEAMISGDLFDQ